MVIGGDLGIDTVRLGGPSRRGFSLSPGWQSTGSYDDDGNYAPRSFLRKLDGGGVLQVMAGQDREYAFVEASLPKIAGGDNVRPLELDHAREVVPKLLAAAEQFVTWDEPVVVNRLDVARDFTDLHEGGAVVLGLSSVPLPGRKVRDLYRDPQHGGAQTLFVRNGGGGCRLYDKHEETRSELALGRFRCEAQERRRGLRNQGVERWCDLTEADITRVGHSRFTWAGFDRPIATAGGALSRILAAPVTDGQRAQMIAGLTLSAEGLWERLGNRQRRSRVRKLLEDHGCFATDNVRELIRLDYHHGVIRKAA
jgi:hypothetical protein